LISLAQVLRAALVSSDSGVSESGPPAKEQDKVSHQFNLYKLQST